MRKHPGDIVVEYHIAKLITLIFGFLFGIITELIHVNLWLMIPIFIVISVILEIRAIFSDIKKLEM